MRPSSVLSALVVRVSSTDTRYDDLAKQLHHQQGKQQQSEKDEESIVLLSLLCCVSYVRSTDAPSK